MRAGRVFGVFALLLIAGSTLAIYEDEIGVIDWNQKNLGHFTDAQFATRSSHLFVASQEGAVASLHSTNGSIGKRHHKMNRHPLITHKPQAWRQILPNKEIASHIQLIPSENGLITLSQNGLHVFLWRAKDGALRWERSLHRSQEDPVIIIEPQIAVVRNELAILNEQGLFLLSLSTGATIWHATPPSGRIVAVTTVNDQFQVILENSGRLDAYRWDTEAGGFHIIISSETMKSNTLSALTVRSVGAYTVLSSSSQLCIYQSQKSKFACQALNSLFSSPVAPEMVVSEQPSGHVLVALWSQKQNKRALYQVGDNGFRSISLSETGTFLEGSGLAVEMVDDDSLQIYQGEKTNRVSLLSLRSSAHGRVQNLWSCPQKQLGLLQNEDDSVTLMVLETGEVQWQRQESLAQVHLAEFVEVPALRSAEEEAVDEKNWSVFSRFYHRLHGQFNAVKRLLSDVVVASDAGPLTADRFGFHKLIILATRSHKLLCLSTQVAYREPIWGLFFAGETIEEMRLTRLSSVQGRSLFVVRTTSAQGKSIMYTIDPFSGSVFSREELEYTVRHSMFLPERTTQGQRVLIQFDTNNHVYPFPSSEETTRLISIYANRTFDVQVEPTSRMEGFGLRVNGDSISMEERWSIALRSGESVVQVVSTSSPHVFSPVRLVAEDSPLSKYLTPTLIAVGTKSREGLGIYLIDSVNGNVIHHTVHHDGAAPLHMVLSENFLVYTYWNKKSYRTEISVIELYEKELDWKATSFSAWTAGAPNVYQQSFVLPLSMSVSAIGISQTRQGITTYNIILGTTSGQLVAIDRRWLDGLRQKDTPIPGVVPYRPEIPVGITSYLSHLEQVRDLSQIAATTTHMESTSMVLAWGLDQFFTHVQPAAKFDMMSQDFDSVSLVVTASLLLVLTLVTNSLNHRRKLATQWK